MQKIFLKKLNCGEIVGHVLDLSPKRLGFLIKENEINLQVLLEI